MVLLARTGPLLIVIDLTARAAALGGPDTSALSSDWDYAASQAFASAVADAGRDGVRYFARHDPAKQLTCNAIFASSGDAALLHSTARALPESLRRRAHAEFGHRIVPVP